MTNIISLTQAETETHSFQNNPNFQGLTISSAIHVNAYQELMNQPGVTMLRTYFGLDSNNKLSIIVVGVDNQGNDITTGVILGDGVRCPNFCPINSPLM